MPGHIRGVDMRRQLKADLIGKDSYRGVTLSYSWLANQFGHISLGFIPTCILYLVVSPHTEPVHAALESALIISAAWLLFETYNFLGPLLLNRHSSSKLVYVPHDQYTFQPAWGNIAFDTITDLSFFWFGAFGASLLAAFSITAMTVLIILVLFLVYPARYWYMTKMYLQVPQYPYQLRLSQWAMPISEENRKKINTFLDPDHKKTHLLLFGSEGSGKTSLSVALATELSIKHYASIYTTGMKLYCMFYNNQQPSADVLWTWRNASVLVIDDINPGNPIKKEIITPRDFQEFLDTDERVNPENRKDIRNMKVIWVLGNPGEKVQLTSTWTGLLEEIGVHPSKILSVNLSDVETGH